MSNITEIHTGVIINRLKDKGIVVKAATILRIQEFQSKVCNEALLKGEGFRYYKLCTMKPNEKLIDRYKYVSSIQHLPKEERSLLIKEKSIQVMKDHRGDKLVNKNKHLFKPNVTK